MAMSQMNTVSEHTFDQFRTAEHRCWAVSNAIYF